MTNLIYDKFLKYKQRTSEALPECAKLHNGEIPFSFSDYEAGYTDRMKEEDNSIFANRIQELTFENSTLTFENKKLKDGIKLLEVEIEKIVELSKSQALLSKQFGRMHRPMVILDYTNVVGGTGSNSEIIDEGGKSK